VLLALALLLLPLGLFIWMVRPRPELPRLEVIAFDQLSLPGEVMLHARLEPVESQPTPVSLDGLPVIFEAGSRDPAVPQVKARSEPGGEAHTSWTFKGSQTAEYRVYYPGDQKRPGVPDRAH